MRFGIELEVVGMSPEDAAALLVRSGVSCNSPSVRHTTQSTWKCVRDGSVSNGFELVSPPMEFNDDTFAAIRNICTILQDAGCGVNTSCGFHVHIEVAQLAAQHVANIYNRYRKFQYKINNFLSRDRRNNTYCRAAASDLRPADTIAELASQRPDRYATVNLQSFIKYGTIEFRQHQGTINASDIVSWVKFLRDFVVSSERIIAEPAPQPVQAYVPPVMVARPIQPTGDMPRSSLQILTLLANGARRSAEEMAQALSMTPDSVRSSISRMRTRNNVNIKFRRGAYSIQVEYFPAAVVAAVVAVAPTPVVRPDHVFRGVHPDLRAFFNRRSIVLAA